MLQRSLAKVQVWCAVPNPFHSKYIPCTFWMYTFAGWVLFPVTFVKTVERDIDDSIQ